MRKRRNFLMMRTRGISGPMMRHKSGWQCMIKSVGNFIGLNLDQSLRMVAGWTGLENCGNLLTYKVDVGRNPSFPDRYGYLDPSDGDAHGSLDNNIIAETIVYGAYSESNFGYSIFRFGVAGNEQIQNLNEITVDWQGYGPVLYGWDNANLNYRFTDAPFANYINSLDGQRVSFDNDYIAVPVILNGTTALRRSVAGSLESNEITISIFIWRNSGVNTGQKIYDIGDGVTNGNDTTRFRHNASGVLKSFLSNVVNGTYTEVASVTAPGASTEDSYHHLFMSGKNDLVDGVGTQVMELWEDGILLGTDTTFFPNASTTFSFVAGDFVTLFARHNLTQFLNGRVAEVWSGGKYMDGSVNISKFRKSTPANLTWNGGIPVDLGATGIVNGVTPSNYLGGPQYGSTDWDNGVNRGSRPDFTKVTAPAVTVVLDDNFSGTDGTQLAGRTPDSVGSGTWVGSTNLTLNGLGEVRHLLTSNLVLDTIDVGISEHISTINLRALAGTANNNQVGVSVRGNQFNDVVYLVALTSFTSRYELKQRVGGGSDTVLGVLDLLGNGIKDGPLTFRATDDATGILCECVEDGTSFFVPSANIDVPPDNNVGVYYRNTVNADEIFVNRITTTAV